VRADALAREELRLRSQSEIDERNLARDKAQAEIKAKHKQFKIQSSNELQQMESMERWELEYQQEMLREEDITAKEMEARLQLEQQLAEEKHKTLRLEYEAKFRKHELAESRRLAPIPEHIRLRARGTRTYRCTSTVHLVYLCRAWHTPMGCLNLCQGCQ